MTITWPVNLEARRWNPTPRNFALGGGSTLTGRERRVFSDAGFWVVSVEEIRVRTREEAHAYRAVLARLREGEDVLLPIREVYKARGARGETSATVAADADLRATTLSVTVDGIEVTAGAFFTIGERLYQVKEVTSGPDAPAFINQAATDSAWSDDVPWADAVSTSTNYTITITPPLRAAVTESDVVEFNDLNVRCVLRDVSDGDLSLDLGRFGAPSLTFIESI
jgi:hypothetical protein